MLVSPEIKDVVLRKLIENFKVGSIVEINNLTNFDDIDHSLLVAILEQFKNFKFYDIYHSSECKDLIVLSLNLHAHDFLRRGGFTGEEILFKDNIEKLYNELEKLQSDNSDTLPPKTRMSVSNAIQVMAALFDIRNGLFS